MATKTKTKQTAIESKEKTKDKIIEEVKAKVEAINKEYQGVELGVWLTPEDVNKLFLLFQNNPGIKLYKLNAIIRID